MFPLENKSRTNICEYVWEILACCFSPLKPHLLHQYWPQGVRPWKVERCSAKFILFMGLFNEFIITELKVLDNPSTWWPAPLTLLEFLHEDVGEEYQDSCWQQPDGTLVYGDDLLQGVDALLHGVGVDVVINGGTDAPHHPHSIHQGFHSGGDHWEPHLQWVAGCSWCLFVLQHYGQREQLRKKHLVGILRFQKCNSK